MRSHHITRILVAVLLTATGGSALAATLAGETYDSDFKLTGAGHNVAATGGQYVISGTGPNVLSTYQLPGPGAGVPFTVSTDVGTAGSPGSFNVGMDIGNNRIAFHPGYTPIPGALRVEGPGGFGNQNVGFVPALGVLHTLTVTGDGAGNFTLSLQDGASPAVYNAAWSNPGNSVSSIGLHRNGNTTTNAMFDNLSVPPAPVETFSSDFSAQVAGRVEAVGGQLEMQGGGTNILTYPGQAGDLLISGKVGASPGSGNTNVGMRIGGNNIVFHANYGGGALRAEGPNGFGNQNMGFTPAGGVLHDMDIAVEAATGKFTIAVTDANNPDNIYVTQFTNPGYTPGADQIGFKYGSGSGGDTGRFDNLQIAQLKPTEGTQSWVNAIQADNPLHWYRLSETGSIAADSGSAGLHGIYRNGVTRGVAGATNGAAQFDGTDDTITLGAADLGGPWTAEFVVKKLAQEASGILLARVGGYALKLDQWNNTGQVGFTRFGTADYLFSPAASVPVGDFMHLTYVGDPSTGLSLYIDGILAGSNSTYIPLPRDEIGSFEPGNMVLDEVVIFDRALNGREILAHAEATRAAALEIPEPATMALAALAISGLAGYVRRRRRA